jgi:hypothetical protein
MVRDIKPIVFVSLLPNGIHQIQFFGMIHRFTLDELLEEYPTEKYTWLYTNTKYSLDILSSICEFEDEEADYK